MPKAIPTTDKEQIVDLCDQQTRRYKDRDEELTELNRLYDDVGIYQDVEEEEVYRVVVPEAASAIDLVTDLISSQDITLTIPAAIDKATEKKQAEQVKTFLLAWHNMMEREEDLDLKRELAQDGMKQGSGVIRLVIDDDRIPSKSDSKEQIEKQAQESFPMIPEIRSYEHIYPIFRRARLVALFDCYELSVLDAKIDYPDLTWPEKWDNDQIITVNEYWTGTHVGIWVSGNPYTVGRVTTDISKKGVFWVLDPLEHRYGRLPYVLRYIRGETKYRNEPAKQSRGYMKTWSGTLKVMNAMESAKLTAGMSYVNNAWLVTTGRRDFKLDLRGNKANYLREGEKVESLQRGTTPVDLMQMSQEWGQKFERQSVPNTVYGEGINNSMAGYAIALQGEAGRRILQPATKMVQECLADMFSTALAILEEYLGPLYKERGVDLIAYTYETKEDSDQRYREEVVLDYKAISGMRYTEVEIGNPMPQDDERAAGLASAMRQPDANGNPLMSDETISEKILKLDPRAERIRIHRQKMQTIIFESVVAEVMQSLGIGPDAEEGDEQMAQIMEMVDQRLSELEQAVEVMGEEHNAIMNDNMPAPPGTPVPPQEMLNDEPNGPFPGLPADGAGLGPGGPPGIGPAPIGPGGSPDAAGPGGPGGPPADILATLLGGATPELPPGIPGSSPTGPIPAGPGPGPIEEL